MILTPCGPSAVPTGGAGVALPAGICSFTSAVTFFAIFYFPYVLSCSESQIPLDLLDLQEVQLDGSRTSENRDHDAQRVALAVDLVHLARKVREWPVDDF